MVPLQISRSRIPINIDRSLRTGGENNWSEIYLLRISVTPDQSLYRPLVTSDAPRKLHIRITVISLPRLPVYDEVMLKFLKQCKH